MKIKALLLLTPLFLASCGGVSSSSSSSLQTSEPSSSSETKTSQASASSEITTSEAQTSEIAPSSEATSFGESSLEITNEGWTLEEVTSEETSDTSESAYNLNLKVATPAGAPAVAFYKHISEEDKVEINADPANVVAYLTSSSDKDIVVCPTNAGLASITKKNAPFKIAATLTFGNFYLASTGNDENATLDPSDYVVAFQKGNVPDKLFSYVYDNLTNVHYVNAATDALQCLISCKNSADEETPNASVDYVLMAEPALTNGLAKNPNASEYANIQEEFAKKSGGMDITQASIFVSNEANKVDVDAFLSSIKTDVEEFLKDPNVIDSYVEGIDASVLQSKFSAPLAALKSQTSRGNRMGLGFKEAKGNKDAIANFASLFGINEIDEEVYYQ